jgi:hypothetical protein
VIASLSLGGLAFLALFGYAIWAAFQPEDILGEDVPVVGAEHIPPGASAVDYNTDPPTSGQHYAETAEAGFYEEAPQDELLVHNLEHGYIVVYYNCEGLDGDACDQLKEGLREAMGAAGISRYTQTPKIIVLPRPGMENPVTYTSWGHIYRADDFDRQEFILYVDQNRDDAPEPFAP